MRVAQTDEPRPLSLAWLGWLIPVLVLQMNDGIGSVDRFRNVCQFREAILVHVGIDDGGALWNSCVTPFLKD